MTGLAPSVVREIIEAAIRDGRKNLLESEAKEICRAYDMPTPSFDIAKDAFEAAAIAEKVAFPVVLKILSPDILHKTEAGGVVLDLKSKAEVEKAYATIVERAKAYKTNARIVGVLVEHMVPKGVEVIVGGLRDSQFGPTVLFGLGGIFVEVLKDVSFRIAPVTNLDCRNMIREINSYSVLKGFRGQPAADEEAIVRIIDATSRLMMDVEEIDQLDLNPVMVYGTGASLVDARIILRP